MLTSCARRQGTGSLSAISNRPIAAEDAKRSLEMAFVSSGLPVLPVLEWDGQVGPIMLALSDLLWDDMKSGPHRTAVPYTQ